MITIIGLWTANALCGGNWNNTLLDGAAYVNLNNTASNTNTNNGACVSYPIYLEMQAIDHTTWWNLTGSKHLLVACRTWMTG